jgi:hypothetical protein
MDGFLNRGTSRYEEEQPGLPAPDGSAVLVTKPPVMQYGTVCELHCETINSMILTLGYIWTIRNVYDAGLLHIVVLL